MVKKTEQPRTAKTQVPKIRIKYSHKRNRSAYSAAEKICGPILVIYKSLTDSCMWKLGPRNFFSGIHKWDFRCSVASSRQGPREQSLPAASQSPAPSQPPTTYGSIPINGIFVAVWPRHYNVLGNSSCQLPGIPRLHSLPRHTGPPPEPPPSQRGFPIPGNIPCFPNWGTGRDMSLRGFSYHTPTPLPTLTSEAATVEATCYEFYILGV
jgi:hypothetical protein